MARPARTTKAKRDRAVGLIERGESTVEDQARRLHVKPRAVRAWLTMAKNGTRTGRRSNAERAALGLEPPPDREASTARLDRALRSAELEDGPADEDEEPSSSSAEPGPIPVPAPDELVAFVETVRGQALKFYAGVLGVDVDDPRATRLLEFTEGERKTLALWAPYAARYVPALVGNSEEVGAWIFVGVNVASLWGAMGALRRLAPVQATRNPGDLFGQAATPSSSPLDAPTPESPAP
jgi:transposase-like protein